MNEFVNLLPFAYRRKILLRRRLRQWSLIWLAGALLAAAATAVQYIQYAQARQLVDSAQLAYGPVQKLIEENSAMRAELEKLHARGTLLEQLSDHRPPLTLLAAASQCAAQCGGRLLLESLVFQRTQHAPDAARRKARNNRNKSPQPPAAAEPWALVTFSGIAEDNLAVATFVVGLRQSGLFRRVELKSATENRLPARAGQSFVVECQI